MRTTVPAEETFDPIARYGLGIGQPSATVWAACPGATAAVSLDTRHAGALPDDGREANIAVSMQVVDDATRRKLEHAVDIALLSLRPPVNHQRPPTPK